ncbi:Alpha/beta hydrolase family protein [Brevibacterium sp. 239c]|uniref:alpha/beta fold hydrolase n=1 Tax=Brevibacterium sp. 239c TaxID=1965356 RepID=UPI000C49D626|nr:alpha/beta fold hydrolase [Brevibacterium sp. 239c]SMY04509.1 Alpha/beta hydrolase family protein [Brevibacterium sp. 239c]
MFDKVSRNVKSILNVGSSSYTQQEALDATFTPIAIGQILASVENLCVAKLYQSDQLLRGTSARDSRPQTLNHGLLTLLDTPFAAKALSLTTLGAAVTLLLSRGRRNPQIVAATALSISTALSEHRTPYGRDGADQMTSVITQYRAISALIPNRDRSDDVFLRAVNVQAGLSYFVSGLSKAFGPSWVRGEAVAEILQTQVYGGSPAAQALKKSHRLMKGATWVTPIWELTFPILYILPTRWATCGLSLVKVFHLGVAAVMELPRFVWGFTGSHGAVKYVIGSSERGEKRLSKLEYSALGSAGVVAYMSGVYAATLRQRDNDRRQGLKGTSQLSVADGNIEFKWSGPKRDEIDSNTAPVIIFEAGLGSALEAWTWVAEELSDHYHVLSYHRAGYGLTTTKLPPGDIVEALLEHIESTGPIVVVGHSFGLIKIADYLHRELRGRHVSRVVLVDGTDPELLHINRSDRQRAAKYLQSQCGSMFVALTGIYNFVPHTVARQSAYAPDEQSGVVQFAFAPKNIYRAIREYFDTDITRVTELIVSGPPRFVVASAENADQQRTLADKLSAPYELVEESSHRSIIGYQSHSKHVAAIIREVVSEI